jgi:hypothetical protein
MTPAAIIQTARAEGVGLALSTTGTIKVTGDGAAVTRWLPTIREHKAQIVAALKVGAGETAFRRWLLHYADREPMEISCSPPATLRAILEWHPDALAAEPLERI